MIWLVGDRWERSRNIYFVQVYLNVAFNRQVSVLPKLYNCGFFISLIGNMRFHLRCPLQYAWELSSQTFKGAAIKFF